jgi:hypothetical protein
MAVSTPGSGFQLPFSGPNLTAEQQQANISAAQQANIALAQQTNIAIAQSTVDTYQNTIAQNNPIDVPDRNTANLFTSTPSPNDSKDVLSSISDPSNQDQVISPATSQFASTQLPAGYALDPDSLGTPAASFTSTQANQSFTQLMNNQLGVGNATISAPIGAASPVNPATLQSLNNTFSNAISTLTNLGANNVNPTSPINTGADQWDRVKLRYRSGHPMAMYPNMLRPLAATTGLVWLYKPSVQVALNVDYEALSLTHSIQEIHAFTANRAAQISVAGQFVSQNVDEAMYSLAAIHFMRSVSKMSFGTENISTLSGLPGSTVSNTPIGSPPPVLLLSGYGSLMFNDVPVIVTNFSLDLPADVDYIEVPTGPGAGTKIPVSFNLQAQLVVQQSPQDMRAFNVDTYTRNGIRGWW